MNLFYKAILISNIIILIFSITTIISLFTDSLLLNHLLTMWHTKEYLLKENKKEIENEFYSKFIDVEIPDYKFWNNNLSSNQTIFFQFVNENIYRVIVYSEHFYIDFNSFCANIDTFKNQKLGTFNSKIFFKFISHSIKTYSDFALIFISSNYFQLISPLYYHKQHYVDDNYYSELLEIIRNSKNDFNANFVSI